MATLQEQISTYRTSTGAQTGAQGWLSKLNIDNKLYQIKDPAVDTLAGYVDTAISGVQSQITAAGQAWKPVTKASGAARVATEVTQDAHGAITVTYDNVLASAVGNTLTGDPNAETVGAQTTQVLTSLSQDVTGAISYTAKNLVAADVASTAVTLNTSGAQGVQTVAVSSTNVQGAIEALAKAVRLSEIKAQAAVDALAGQDWSTNAETVANLIKELNQIETTDPDGLANSVIDTFRTKLGSLNSGNNSTGTYDGTVKKYVDNEIAVLANAINNKNVSASSTTSDWVEASAANNAVSVGLTTRSVQAMGYAESALQTIGADGTLLTVGAKSGDAGAGTQGVAPTQKLTDAVAAAESALQTVSGDTATTNPNGELIQVSEKTGADGAKTQAITSTTKLTTAVAKAETAVQSVNGAGPDANGAVTIYGTQVARTNDANAKTIDGALTDIENSITAMKGAQATIIGFQAAPTFDSATETLSFKTESKTVMVPVAQSGS